MIYLKITGFWNDVKFYKMVPKTFYNGIGARQTKSCLSKTSTNKSCMVQISSSKFIYKKKISAVAEITGKNYGFNM